MEDRGTPAVSVIVPSYNRAEFLPEAVLSVAAQEFPGLEVILVDDGSSDHTRETALELGSRCPEISLRYIRQEHAGISAARNRGIREARGRWIAFLDSDDRWCAGKIAKQMAYLREHPDCAIVFTEYRNFLDPSVTDAPTDLQLLLMEEKEYRLLSTMVAAREVFEECGLLSEDMACGEDSEWVLRARMLGHDITHCIGEVLYERRIHGGCISLENRGDERTRIGRVMAAAIRNAGRIRRNGK